MAKKNDVMIFGKKFRVLKKTGHIIAAPEKIKNEYANCIRKEMATKDLKGKSQNVIRQAFQDAVKTCSGHTKVSKHYFVEKIGGAKTVLTETEKADIRQVKDLAKKKKKYIAQ